MPSRERSRVSTAVSSWAPTRGFRPSDIAGCEFWLHADSIAQADATAITVWTDSSGMGHSVGQFTVDSKPTLKTNVVNGHAVARFDGGDSLNMGGGFLTPCHLFAVIKPVAGGYKAIIGGTTGSANVEWRVDNNEKVSFLKSQVANVGTSTSAVPTDAYSHINVSYSSPDCAFRLNGVDDGTGSSAQGVLIVSTVGYANLADPFNGDIAELIGYSAVLSEANRNIVEAYLAAKYAIS